MCYELSTWSWPLRTSSHNLRKFFLLALLQIEPGRFLGSGTKKGQEFPWWLSQWQIQQNKYWHLSWVHWPTFKTPSICEGREHLGQGANILPFSSFCAAWNQRRKLNWLLHWLPDFILAPPQLSKDFMSPSCVCVNRFFSFSCLKSIIFINILLMLLKQLICVINHTPIFSHFKRMFNVGWSAFSEHRPHLSFSHTFLN